MHETGQCCCSILEYKHFWQVPRGSHRMSYIVEVETVRGLNEEGQKLARETRDWRTSSLRVYHWRLDIPSKQHSTTIMASLKTLLRTPPALRPLLLQHAQRSLYHSYEHVPPPPYPEPQSKILTSALSHVPISGWTTESLTLGAKDNGYLDISTNLFPRGPFDLVQFYLVTQRLALKDRVQFDEAQKLGVGRKVKSLVLARLQANIDAGIVPRWTDALGLMSLAENIPASMKELGLLSDEIWFLAGDTSVDSSWYTKRGTLSAVYAATEVFQTKDQSSEFRDTEAFLDRRLEEVRVLGSAVGGTMEWMGFQAGAVVNLMRSKGVRI